MASHLSTPPRAGLATYRSTLAVPGSIKKDYIISQGTKLGRKGNIHVKHEEGTNTIWIGGQATVCISGNVVF
jgi:predicted PhzF superfamily epimerase YddE/YHI9